MTSAPHLDCSKQARCAGCPLGGADYEASLRDKARRVADALGEFEVETRYRPIVGGLETHGYRPRAKLVADGERLGLYARGTHEVVDTEGCRVVTPAVERGVAAVRGRLPLPIEGVDVRETSEGLLITLLSGEPAALDRLRDVAGELVGSGEALSAAVLLREPGGPRLLGGDLRALAGPTEARQRLGSEAPYVYATHGAFVQAHLGQAARLYERVAEELERPLGSWSGRRVLELFAGSGALALDLARRGATVVAVESFQPQLELLQRAATEQDLPVTGVAADATAFVVGARRRAERFDAVVVNPPRRGLTAELRSAVAALGADVVVYVSCDPETLARDLAHFAVLGLAPESVEPFDMIPWSEAVETLAVLRPRPASPPRVLWQSEALLAVNKAPHEPLEARAGEASLLARVRALPGFSQAVVVLGLPEPVSGVCLFARSPELARAERATVEGARSRFVALVRGATSKRGRAARWVRERRATASPGIEYERREKAGRHSLLELSPERETTAEIAAQLARFGHPILGDRRSGDARSNQYLEHRHGLDRPFLHRSAVTLPEGSGPQLTAELPADLRRVLDRVRRPRADEA